MREKVFTVSVLFHALVITLVGILWTSFITFCMISCSIMSDSFAVLWTATHQTPLFMGLSRPEYWSELPFPPPRGLPEPGIKPVSPATPALEGRFFTTEPPGKPSKRYKEL